MLRMSHARDETTRLNLRTLRRDCFCNYQFNVKSCSIQGIFKTADVLEHDPGSFMCDADKVNVISQSLQPACVALC